MLRDQRQFTVARHRRRAGARRSEQGRRALLVVLVVLVVVVLLGAVQLVRGVPGVVARRLTAARLVLPRSGAALPSPAPGASETAVDVVGIGTMVSSGGAVQVPIASVTKLMSALVILSDHPLGVGASGPDISITAADVANYQSDKAADDSVVAVTRGEQLSELDALEAALVPSADNVIQLLATWDAGSTRAFVSRMNAEARRLGLTHTHYAGPSGVNPATVSTAADEVRVAAAVMANPVLASIVAQPQVTLPVAGVQYNVNADLGRDGIVGVKTGWVPAGGASFVFAARRTVAGKSVLVVGAIVGDQRVPAIPTVLTDARRIVREAGAAVSRRLVVTGGERVATLSDAGETIPVEAARSASLLAWNGAHLTQSVTFSPHVSLPVAAGTRVGTIEVALGDEHAIVPIVAGARLSSPSLSWRLVHG